MSGFRPFPGHHVTAAPVKSWLRAALAMFAVGWGANQFASMLLVYRERTGVSVGTADALFGFYALGLIPALLVGGPLSDRFGRRALARPAVVLSLVATVVLLLGAHQVPLLYLARLLAGVASGLIFAPGTAWVRELSAPPWDTTADAQAGARRPAIWLSAGFGTGPLVAGVLAEYLPAPLLLPYVPHLVVVVLAGATVWNAPETVEPAPGAPVLARLRVRSVRAPRFPGIVTPLAPWVFGAASISITLGAAFVAERTGGFAVAFAGIVAGLTLGTGVLIQPLARRLDAAGDVRGATVGLVAAAVGCLVEAAAAATAQPVLALVGAVLLGAAYGTCLVAGLLETQRIAPADEQAGLTAVYYALTYLGFGVPLLLTALTAFAAYDVLLVAMAALAVVVLVVVRVADRRAPQPAERA